MNTSELKEITQLITRHAVAEGASSTANPSLEVARHSTCQTALRCPQSPFFGMVVQGRMSIQLGDTVRHFAQGDYLFVSFSVPVAFHIIEASADQPCLGFGMAITPERLHEVLARMDIPPHPSTTHEACSVVVDRLNPELLDATLRLLRLLDAPGDIQSLAPLIEQEIIYRLLSSLMAAACCNWR
ncbi:AraC family transcriptional regulator [Pseudomonas piscis]|uniref:AraC family transcriptional regulator n=1 Tax=Pseudomonas piscis TaxID=2614538 RepID=UPI0003B4C267|nr:AraC family transcriptional regulator [Pseudomonas piscis]ERO60109.1 hypothetical protein P308_15575 [Pseudomonas piscis]